MKGPVAVTVRRFINAGLTLAGASHPAFDLWSAGAHPLGGDRAADMCGEPRRLSAVDVFEMDGSSSTHIDVGWLVISEAEEFRNIDHRAQALAHELGHVLLVGHGNGLDDNADGGQPAAPGPRLYDQYCDPLGTTANGEPEEDAGGTESACSLMGLEADCRELTPLQREHARAAASVMPGCAGADCRP